MKVLFILLIGGLILSGCASSKTCNSPEFAFEKGLKDVEKERDYSTAMNAYHGTKYEICSKVSSVGELNEEGYKKGVVQGLKERCAFEPSRSECQFVHLNSCFNEEVVSEIIQFEKNKGFFFLGNENFATKKQMGKTQHWCKALHGGEFTNHPRFKEMKAAQIAKARANYCTSKKAYKVGLSGGSMQYECDEKVTKAYDRGFKKHSIDAEKTRLSFLKETCNLSVYYKMGLEGEKLSLGECSKVLNEEKIISFYNKGRNLFLKEKNTTVE